MRQQLWITALLGSLVVTLLQGHEPKSVPPDVPPPKPVEEFSIQRLMTADEAIQLAWQDSQRLDPLAALQVRYIWLGPQATALDVKAAAIALNIISRSPVLQRPELVNGNLLRVTLSSYAPRKNDLKDWLKFWEDLQFDPTFNLLLTKATIASAQKTLLVGLTLPEHKENFDVIRVNGPHIDGQTFVQLQERTASQAPVVSLPYFLLRVLTTIKDKNLYATLYGGRYFEFAGVKKAKDVYENPGKTTDLDVFLEERGIGNTQVGFKFAELFDKLRSDQRVAQRRSGVTGKARVVLWFHGPDAKDGTGTISITLDIRDQDVDIDTQPFMNLLNPKFLALEAIAEKSNGMHVYALFNDKEELLDEAAIEVAADRTIPAPHTPRLQSGISCMACHEADGSDGWKAVHNDVSRQVNKITKLDILTDLSDQKKDTADILDRLKGLYGGDFTKSLRRARDDYAETILRAAGPWPAAAASGQTDVVKVGVGYTVAKVRNYQYNLVDAKTALDELGYTTQEGNELRALEELLPPDQQARIGGVILEDERIGSLRAGSPIERNDFNLVYAFAAARAQKAFKELEKKSK